MKPEARQAGCRGTVGRHRGCQRTEQSLHLPQNVRAALAPATTNAIAATNRALSESVLAAQQLAVLAPATTKCNRNKHKRSLTPKSRSCTPACCPCPAGRRGSAQTLHMIWGTEQPLKHRCVESHSQFLQKPVCRWWGVGANRAAAAHTLRAGGRAGVQAVCSTASGAAAPENCAWSGKRSFILWFIVDLLTYNKRCTACGQHWWVAGTVGGGWRLLPPPLPCKLRHAGAGCLLLAMLPATCRLLPVVAPGWFTSADLPPGTCCFRLIVATPNVTTCTWVKTSKHLGWVRAPTCRPGRAASRRACSSPLLSCT